MSPLWVPIGYVVVISLVAFLFVTTACQVGRKF